MASIYDVVINTLFATGKAELVTHKSREAIVIAGVKKVKSQRNRMRCSIGELKTSKMTITVHKISDHKVKVVFALIYSIDI